MDKFLQHVQEELSEINSEIFDVKFLAMNSLRDISRYAGEGFLEKVAEVTCEKLEKVMDRVKKLITEISREMEKVKSVE